MQSVPTPCHVLIGTARNGPERIDLLVFAYNKMAPYDPACRNSGSGSGRSCLRNWGWAVLGVVVHS